MVQKKEEKQRESARKIDRIPKPIFVVTRCNSADRLNKTIVKQQTPPHGS